MKSGQEDRKRGLPPGEIDNGPPTHGRALLLARYSFVLLIVSLAWMKAPLAVRGLEVIPADLLFLVTAGFWLLALATRQTNLRLHPAFWLLGLYLAAMALSIINSTDPERSAFKLLTQVYLLALPVLAINLIRSRLELRRVIRWWVIAATALGLLGVLTLALFPLLGPAALDWPLHHFGTLPAGRYPRLELTFIYPSILANYLAVSLMLLLIARRLGWIGRRWAVLGGAAILASALFAMTPGFGGVIFMLGIWAWHLNRGRPNVSRLWLGAAIAAVPAMVAISAVTPIIHPVAPYVFTIPSLDVTLAPAARLLAWIDAMRNFLAAPLLGHGIGMDAVSVLYIFPDSSGGLMTDAHNAYLNIAAQCGLIGLAAMLALIAYVGRLMVRSCGPGSRDPLVFGLTLAWISAFAVQGLVGGFEDSRHLWLLFGLILSAAQLESDSRPVRRKAVP